MELVTGEHVQKKEKKNKSVTCNLVGKKFFNIEVFVYGTGNLAS